jgi:hypothetical protein
LSTLCCVLSGTVSLIPVLVQLFPISPRVLRDAACFKSTPKQQLIYPLNLLLNSFVDTAAVAYVVAAALLQPSGTALKAAFHRHPHILLVVLCALYLTSITWRRLRRYKTRMCRHWVDSMGMACPHGIRCTFAHGPTELATFTSMLNVGHPSQHGAESDHRAGLALTGPPSDVPERVPTGADLVPLDAPINHLDYDPSTGHYVDHAVPRRHGAEAMFSPMPGVGMPSAHTRHSDAMSMDGKLQ